MPVTIELREYGRTTVALPDGVARRLRHQAAGRLEVMPAGQDGSYEVVASQHVGTISLPEVDVLIRPKVEVANLFWLLEAGEKAVETDPSTFEYGSAPDLLPAFATFFARVVDTTTARGLLRSYRVHNERLPLLRGRIDLPAQMREPAVVHPLACEFDEYTADIFENRMLKAAVRRLNMLSGVPPLTRRRLLRLQSTLDEVGDEVPDPDAVLRIHFDRLNRHYEAALRLARHVLRSTSIVDERGGLSANTFLIDMNKVFEEFVEHSLRRALEGRLLVEGQAKAMRLDVGRRVTIKPDLVFRHPRAEAPAYVGDVKYKVTASGLGRESDYYQLLAYTSALGLSEGVLIYFQHDGSLPDEVVTVSNVGKDLRTYALDLSGDLTQLRSGIERLADWIADRACRCRS